MTSFNKTRSSILIAIDGSRESLDSLGHAARLGGRAGSADISLLYVKPFAPPASEAPATVAGGAGLALLVAPSARIETPALTVLKRARDQLVRLGVLAADWQSGIIEEKHLDRGAGNVVVSSTSRRSGQSLNLIVREAPSLVTGILNEARFYQYDLTIVAPGRTPTELSAASATRIASEHEGAVIVSRGGNGGDANRHLVCVSNSDASIAMVAKSGEWARRCGCSITLYSVAEDESRLELAKAALGRAERALGEAGMASAESLAEVGDPTWRIIERGREHSLIVLADSDRSPLKRLLSHRHGVTRSVLQKAHSSVMVLR